MPDITELILASTSPYRRVLLARLGLPFRVCAPACDEEALKDPRLTPQALAEKLALAKAESLVAAHPTAVIIGSDQVAAVECDGAWRLLGKPGSAERAVDQLALLSGREHVLVTAVTLVQGQRRWQHTDVTRLTMRALDKAALARYVAADQPINCAGAYKLEERGIALFSRINSADHTAITGLPLIALGNALAEWGFAVPGACP